MATTNISAPPMLSGNDRDRLLQMHNYLFQMHEQINYALQSMAGDHAVQEQSGQIAGKVRAEVDKELNDQYQSLKSLIIKTADIVRMEMDQIVATLNSDYVASSVFGEYQEQVTNQIDASATGIIQSYHLESVLTPSSEKIVEFEEWIAKSDQYIKTGLLYYDDENNPVFGVAVGNGLTTQTVNGETVIKKEKLMSTFTADKLSFWQNNKEVAYLSNQKLFITFANILSGISVGHFVTTVVENLGNVEKWVN